jgi:hypothetical protein
MTSFGNPDKDLVIYLGPAYNEKMKRILLTLCLFFILGSFSAQAARAQVFSDQPLCLVVYNSTDREVVGHVETDAFYDVTGKLSWHRQNFRLDVQKEERVCSTGPFFKGYKLRVVIKTIMPLYSCKTDMNRKITISRKIDETGFNTYVMDCPSEKGAQAAE